jgi:pimeloyl-ACP methyl ester carboxylesterase
MEYIAGRGYDVYLVNIRGYGPSTRPPEMDAPADKNPPVVHTSTAMRDYAAAANFVMERRAIRSLNVVGWSWGTVICALYASTNPDKVNRLVLHAPAWLRKTSALIDTGRTLGAYRKVTADDARKRWATGIPAGKRTVLPQWQEDWIRAIFASDPIGQKADPPYIRAPNGVVQDSRDYWASGKPVYQPADILAPTLLILGEWDADTPVYMAQALFSALGNARAKRLVVIGESTHMLMLEQNRMQLFEEVQLFLDSQPSQN